VRVDFVRGGFVWPQTLAKGFGMKRATAIFTMLFLLGGIQAGVAQGFVNLDFESANIPSGTAINSSISVTDALPGWTASFSSPTTGIIIDSMVNYDSFSEGGPIISVNDTNLDLSGFGPTSGKYSVYLFSGNQGNTLYTASISQTGLVPGGTESLQFQVGIGTSPFTVSLGGETINVVPLQTFSAYTLYGGDVSSFADEGEPLTFTETFPTMGSPPGMLSLDNIIFSASPVPEPGTGGLILCGAVLFGLKRWRKAWA
jgi:hypothetical protein